MKNEYLQAYADIYDQLPRNGFPYGDDTAIYIDEIKEIVDEAAKSHPGRELRADAKLFLVLNFYQMVFLPMVRAPQSATKPSRRRLLALIADDTQTIIETARSQRPESDHDRPEISGGQIAEALGKAYRKLKLSEINLWG